MGKAPGGPSETHGLRRTNEDKRRAVMMLLDDPEWATWSDNAIAKACRVSRSIVESLRKPSLAETQVTTPAERTYITKHGTTATMATANIGKAKPESGAMVYRAGTLKVIQATDTGNPATLTH